MFASLLLSLPRSRNSPLLVAVLNTTVAQMAKSVSMVLTMAYRDIYGEDEDADDPAQLMLLTAPLAATEAPTSPGTYRYVHIMFMSVYSICFYVCRFLSSFPTSTKTALQAAHEAYCQVLQENGES